MPYIQTKTRAGKTLIIEKYYSGRYRKKNTLRQKNFRKTTEAQEACNERKARRNLTALINANFGSDDYHLVLDYRPEERPATVEEAKDNIRPFIRSLRRMYKKAGLQLKYVESCEFGKKGALHHHLVINGGVPTAEIARKWKYGWSHFNQLDDTGEYSRLASYIIKNRKQWKRCGGTGRQYSHSRDMKMPERKTEVIKTRDGYYEKPRERKGWHLAGYSVEHGYTKDGWPYMRYILIRDESGRKPAKPKRKRTARGRKGG